MTLDALRQQFPHTEDEIYINHAATGPLSQPVKAAMEAYVRERHGANIDNYEAFQPTAERARRRVGRLLGAAPERIAFVQNTSTALGLLAEGLSWEPGDRLAVPACEFPANVYPFLHLERRGVAVDFIPHEEGTFSVKAVEAALTPETRLLTLSFVQFLSGFRADLEALGRLCAERGVLFCVDAIQGLGALQLDVEACSIDFLACGGHKWLLATQGIAFLYVRESVQEKITPPAGWLHGPVDWENFFDYELAFHPEARRFEVGTMNNLGLAALDAALGLHFEMGPAWCEQQVLARAQQLAGGLRTLGLRRYGSGVAACASGIVTVRHPQAGALFAHLKENRITAALRNRMLRFSPTYYNSPGDVDAVLEAVAAFEEKGAARRKRAGNS